MRVPLGFRVATPEEVAQYGRHGGHKALRARGLLPPIAGGAGPAYIQGNNAASGSTTGTTWPCSFVTQNPAAGNLIVAACGWAVNNFAGFGVSDNSGDGRPWNLPTGARAQQGAGSPYSIAVAWKVTGPGWTTSTAITLATPSSGFRRLLVHEYAGADSLDVAVNATSGAGTGLTATSPAFTTAYVNEIIFCWPVFNSGTPTPDARFLTRQTCASEISEDDIVSSVQTGFQATATSSANDFWAITVATFYLGQPLVQAPFPIFLPRQLGPEAVGPTYFARWPLPQIPAVLLSADLGITANEDVPVADPGEVLFIANLNVGETETAIAVDPGEVLYVASLNIAETDSATATDAIAMAGSLSLGVSESVVTADAPPVVIETTGPISVSNAATVTDAVGASVTNLNVSVTDAATAVDPGETVGLTSLNAKATDAAVVADAGVADITNWNVAVSDAVIGADGGATALVQNLTVTVSDAATAVEGLLGVTTLGLNAINVAEPVVVTDQVTIATFSLATVRPFGDLDVDSWVVPPLWSKISDQSDATTITAVLA